MQTLANWPPNIPGSCKWWASLQGRRLVLAHDPEPPPEDGSSHHSVTAKRDLQATHGDSRAREEALIVREINMEGCRCGSVHICTVFVCMKRIGLRSLGRRHWHALDTKP